MSAAVALVLAVPAMVLLGGAHGLFRRRDEPDLPPPPPDPAVGLRHQLDALHAQIDGRVPTAVESRVDRIVAILRETLPRLDQLGMGSQQAHAAVQTVASYLPEALGAYMRLPRDYADQRPVSNGKTSLMVLCDQLDLLAHKMDEVYVAVCQSDADALVAHGRFLAEKFGAGSLSIGTGPA